MKFIVIRYGSIGKRHMKNINALDHGVILLRHSRNNINTESLTDYNIFIKKYSKRSLTNL